MRRRRFKWIVALMLLALLVGGLGWLIYAPVRQERLNHALIAAIKQNDTKTALALLADGADPNSRDEPPQHLSLWRLLLDRLQGKRPAPSTASTALLVCTAWTFKPEGDVNILISPPENPALLKGLLDKGANVNVTDEKGRTPLLFTTMEGVASRGARYKTVQLLLDYGANLNPALNGNSPLTMTILGTYTKDEVIARMIERGANINIQDVRGDTPLLCAVQMQRLKVIQMLLDHHADVNIKDRNGSTALRAAEQFAATRTGQKIIRMLKQAGAKE